VTGMDLWKSYKELIVSTVENREKIDMQLQVIAGNHYIPTGKVTITNGATLRELKFKISWTNTQTAVVRSIEWQGKKESSAKGAIGGAVAGAILSGGIGAIAGAAIGGRSKDASTAVIGLEDDKGQVSEIYVKCSGKEYETLQRLIMYEESEALKNIKGMLNK